jgi:hypothetical protein
MANRNCFRKSTVNTTSSDNTKHIKQTTIFRGAVNVAKNNGKLVKKTPLGKNNGTYVGKIYTTTNGSQKLIGASSYEDLYDVTSGKYLSDPLSFGIPNTNNLWEGSIYVSYLNGLITMDSKITQGNNYMRYPIDINATHEYPDNTNPQAGGIYIDPCYNVFYPKYTSNGAYRSACYLNDELSYTQNIIYKTNSFEQLANRYLAKNKSGSFIYPAANLSLKCDEYWKNDISNNNAWN